MTRTPHREDPAAFVEDVASAPNHAHFIFPHCQVRDALPQAAIHARQTTSALRPRFWLLDFTHKARDDSVQHFDGKRVERGCCCRCWRGHMMKRRTGGVVCHGQASVGRRPGGVSGGEISLGTSVERHIGCVTPNPKLPIPHRCCRMGVCAQGQCPPGCPARLLRQRGWWGPTTGRTCSSGRRCGKQSAGAAW